ncbi:MAG: hypothetical protein CBB68_13360 [Rhodospirillaceae bacterium TMED8]|nr:hypothetical protein [Magnetovibrio sp.]OUT48550.1 MAG: hypothetical protein CBB68_13360 [Rhodospirillaceae bacterium TMED8]|tara:strand:+ start:123 stop:752 length:630 start_codon:yes stop_codon:yes gene_type:complete
MFFRRCALGPILLVFSCSVLVNAVVADNHGDKSAYFIRSLAENAINFATDLDTPRPKRIEKFREMVNESFAIRSLAKRALGRYWRLASENQKRRYLDLFEDLMVVTYFDRLSAYAGGELDVLSVRMDDNFISTVFSHVRSRSDAKAVRTEWVVGTNGAISKILDVKIEGVSMAQTLHADFGSIIRRGKQGIADLLYELERKTLALRVEN